MCDCLRSIPLVDFKVAAIEQKLISPDVAFVFHVLKSFGHCAKERLQQVTRFTARRLDKALNQLIVLEKVVRINGELIFVQLPPELEALVSAQAHATTDEEVAALCAAPAPAFTQAVVSTTSTTTDASADQPWVSDSEVVTEPKANLKSSAETEAEVGTTFEDSSESEPVTKDSVVNTTTSPCADEPKADVSVVLADTSSAQNKSVSEAAAATTSVAQVATKDIPVSDTKPLTTNVATDASASQASPVGSAVQESQSAVVVNAASEEQSASEDKVSVEHNAEPMAQPKATTEPDDIPVLQAEPVETPVFANVANGQRAAMVVTTQRNESQTVAYVSTAHNSVPASGVQQYQSQFAVPQQYQPQFATPPAQAMQSMQSACGQVVGDHPRDLQEVITYIQEHPSTYAHLLNNPKVDIVTTAENFYDHYANNGWQIGNKPIRDWTLALKQAAGRGNNARGNRKGWAINYFDTTDVLSELKAGGSAVQRNQANGQGAAAQMQYQSQSWSQTQHSQSSLQAPALGQAHSQPMPLGQLSAMRANQAVFNGGKGSYNGQQSPLTQYQSSPSQRNTASLDPIGSDDVKIIDSPEWLAMGKERQNRINTKMVQLIGHPPKKMDYIHSGDGSMSLGESEAYDKDYAEYIRRVNRVRPQLIQKYKDVPTAQL